jgi:hypothetical protein
MPSLPFTSSQWEEALLLLDAMPDEALSPPDHVSYHTAIAACRRAVSIGVAASRKSRRAAARAQAFQSGQDPEWKLKESTWGEQEFAARKLGGEEIPEANRKGTRGKSTIPAEHGGAEGFAPGSDADRSWRQTRRAARAAVGLLRRMRASRLRPSLIGYTTAMNALSAAGYVRAALCVYRGMAAELAPDAKCVETALGACERGGRWGEGLRLIKELRGRGPAGAALATEFAEWAGKAERMLLRNGPVRPSQAPRAAGRQQRGRGGSGDGRVRSRQQHIEREKAVRASKA